ncbi:hypothetical protein PSQ19_05300 [Devosia algicola]|uniref:Uncharacterized protein n=1 Tax=Devosia algicola TaxID=3026418 RepID=A0ABY7YQH8_9HYPH|nr:hypothetical protein [Devosia algicola]WDR03511.1 hypothetical protein PSQ19_05300 [Devosia algicola]
MKRYDPANLLMRDTVRAWKESGDKGRLLYLRAHGFCGNWTAGRDKFAIISTDEAMPDKPRDEFKPDWLPADQVSSYIGYLQQYTHNINLARFVLDAPYASITVKATDLDGDGMTGVVLMELGGTRVSLESAQTRFHGWDEHTQVYFEGVGACPLAGAVRQSRPAEYRNLRGRRAASLSHANSDANRNLALPRRGRAFSRSPAIWRPVPIARS